jgi:hypothetical protein
MRIVVKKLPGKVGTRGGGGLFLDQEEGKVHRRYLL